LHALQKACDELERGYRPGITFLVVQKRHHARFFPIYDRDRVGSTKRVDLLCLYLWQICYGIT